MAHPPQQDAPPPSPRSRPTPKRCLPPCRQPTDPPVRRWARRWPGIGLLTGDAAVRDYAACRTCEIGLGAGSTSSPARRSRPGPKPRQGVDTVGWNETPRAPHLPRDPPRQRRPRRRMPPPAGRDSVRPLRRPDRERGDGTGVPPRAVSRRHPTAPVHQSVGRRRALSGRGGRRSRIRQDRATKLRSHHADGANRGRRGRGFRAIGDLPAVTVVARKASHRQESRTERSSAVADGSAFVILPRAGHLRAASRAFPRLHARVVRHGVGATWAVVTRRGWPPGRW